MPATETTSGTIYNQNGQYPEAVVILKKALAKDPKDSKAQFQIAFAYSKLDSVALAYQHFMKAKELDPKKANDVADNIASNYARHYKVAQNAFARDDFASAATRCFSLRKPAIWRAFHSSVTPWKRSPAVGSLVKPMTSTGVDGPAT